MCVNKVPFLHSMSEGTMLRTSSHLTLLNKTSLKYSGIKIARVCKNGGFQIKHIDADVQFECLQEEIEGVEIDIVDADEHAEEVERAMRTVK